MIYDMLQATVLCVYVQKTVLQLVTYIKCILFDLGWTSFKFALLTLRVGFGKKTLLFSQYCMLGE